MAWRDKNSLHISYFTSKSQLIYDYLTSVFQGLSDKRMPFPESQPLTKDDPAQLAPKRHPIRAQVLPLPRPEPSFQAPALPDKGLAKEQVRRHSVRDPPPARTWAAQILQSLCPSHEPPRPLYIVVVGGQGSGKTTLCRRLTSGVLTSGNESPATSTIPYARYERRTRDWILRVTELPQGQGEESGLNINRDYFYALAHVILFALDLTNYKWLIPAMEELEAMLVNPFLKYKSILVLGNKSDLIMDRVAIEPGLLIRTLGLEEMEGAKSGRLLVGTISAGTKEPLILRETLGTLKNAMAIIGDDLRPRYDLLTRRIRRERFQAGSIFIRETVSEVVEVEDEARQVVPDESLQVPLQASQEELNRPAEAEEVMDMSTGDGPGGDYEVMTKPSFTKKELFNSWTGSRRYHGYSLAKLK